MNLQIDIQPVFILGCPRSGTTLMGNYLNSAAHLYGLGEFMSFFTINYYLKSIYSDDRTSYRQNLVEFLLVPPLIRNELQPNKTVTVNGFITKRIVNNNGSIQIQLTVTDLVEQTQNKYSDEEIKKIELMQAKAAAGFRDIYAWLKENILKDQPFKIGVIMGKTGIIDNDIKHQL
jgi:Sulfotransferase family